MKRIPLKDRILPNYTQKEEFLNMLTHLVGIAVGITVLVLSIIIANKHASKLSMLGGCIFGGAMILLYTVSSTYHGAQAGIFKKIMQVLDHCTIYLLIVGTYVPIIIAGIMPHSKKIAMLLLVGELLFACLGTVFTAIDHNKYKRISMACYIGMGWLVILALKQTIRAMTLCGFLWLLVGGVLYTIGAVLYGIGKKKGNGKFHVIFHLFVVAASVAQAVAVLGYVI